MIALNQMHYTNPYVVAAWSFFFPGFGYIILGEYIQGWMLFLWELLVNVRANFNTAIVLAFTGKFHESADVLAAHGDYWILLYAAVYVYSVVGSYRLAVEANNMFTLAYEENAPIEVFKINAFQFNFFNKKDPWMGAFWSLLMPGLGEMYLRRFTSALFSLGWWMAIVHFSHVLPAMVYTFTGHFRQAVSVLNTEWLLYLPSMYGFAFYNAYVSIVEQDKVFEQQQANYLQQQYQNPSFPIHLHAEEADAMRIVSTFDHSLYLEKAIVHIEKLGIQKTQMFAVPIKKRKQMPGLSLDSLHHSDGKSFFDVPSLLAAFFCALGTIYGFALYWGPVLWGMIGFAGGFLLGAIIKLLTMKPWSNHPGTRPKTEVVLMIDCKKEEAAQLEQILWSNQAFGVAKVGTD